MGDFGKYRYDLQQKAKDAKKKQKAVTWKEIRVSPKIDDHDIETKIRSAAKFLDEGDKLKVTVRFRGRELAHPDRGRVLLIAIGDKLKDHGVIERAPLLEGRQMHMVMNPVRRDAVSGAPTPQPPAPPAPPASAAPKPPAPGPRPAPPAEPPPTAPAPARPPAALPTPPPRAQRPAESSPLARLRSAAWPVTSRLAAVGNKLGVHASRRPEVVHRAQDQEP